MNVEWKWGPGSSQDTLCTSTSWTELEGLVRHQAEQVAQLCPSSWVPSSELPCPSAA
jgi:hypothetical protein